MLKAVFGGGGKGMRIVRGPDELGPALEACQREAAKSFGDSAVLLERYLERPRHVELQVFADHFGGVVHLFERDCSVQRRHQKVLEESPAPGLPRALRDRMGEAAKQAARAVGYVGAGTVEFMVDTDRPGEFYFMEMNTRLQVEHPVTEAVTGQDLVEWQLRVASGQRLPRTQQELAQTGHAVEARVYAENPLNNFLPATGTLHHLRAPTGAEGVRVDTGIVGGDAVSIYYDPMIAKVIAWGADRGEAIHRLQAALRTYQIVGVPNNIAFLRRCLAHKAFLAGGVDTSFLRVHLDEVLPTPAPASATVLALAALTRLLRHQAAARGAAAGSGDATSPWAAGDAARPAGDMGVVALLHDPARAKAAADAPHGHAHGHAKKAAGAAGGRKKAGGDADAAPARRAGDVAVKLSVAPGGPRSGDSSRVRRPLEYLAAVDGVEAPLRVSGRLAADGRELEAWVDGRHVFATVVELPATTAGGEPSLTLFCDTEPGAPVTLTLPQPVLEAGSASKGGAAVVTPMPGKVVKVLVAAGDAVVANTPLLILEAMKMEHVVRATAPGTVAAVRFAAGEQVDNGSVLVEFKA
jgi:3-methylcrotonyl-CoA carboxylase alpha subunit